MKRNKIRDNRHILTRAIDVVIGMTIVVPIVCFYWLTDTRFRFKIG